MVTLSDFRRSVTMLNAPSSASSGWDIRTASDGQTLDNVFEPPAFSRILRRGENARTGDCPGCCEWLAGLALRFGRCDGSAIHPRAGREGYSRIVWDPGSA